MDFRNSQFLFYGFSAAWLVLVLYVISIGAREKKLRDELDRIKKLVEQGEKEYNR